VRTCSSTRASLAARRSPISVIDMEVCVLFHPIVQWWRCRIEPTPLKYILASAMFAGEGGNSLFRKFLSLLVQLKFPVTMCRELKRKGPI
jgi:hypothetical protein